MEQHPRHLTELVQKYKPVKSLSSVWLYFVPKRWTAKDGMKSFSATALNMWNELSEQIKLASGQKLFCTILKTELYKLAYCEHEEALP